MALRGRAQYPSFSACRPDWIMRDQRHHRRLFVRQRVWCESDHVTLYVQALNVSGGGFFVRTASPAPVGSEFRVAFHDTEGAEIVANVTVAWARAEAADLSAGMGLRIVNIERGKEAFDRFLARHATRRDGEP